LSKENIKGDKASNNMEHGQLSKRKKKPMDTLEHFAEKEEG
jgi:hypothetical protein